MPSRRFYANSAPQQTLAAAITASATTLTIQSSFTGWPASFPFFAVLEAGTANQEIVLVTGITGLVATITRGQDGSVAVAHSAGGTFDQMFVRQDADEANAHTTSNSGVHGVSGAVVGTSDVQTLSSKTLSSPVLTGTMSGSGGLNVGGNITTSGALSVAGTAAITGDLTVTGKVSGKKIDLFGVGASGLTAGTPTAPFYIQAGTASPVTGSDGKTTLTLPVAFPNGIITIDLTPADGTTTTAYLTGAGITNGAAQIQARDATNAIRATVTIKVCYIAYGW